MGIVKYAGSVMAIVAATAAVTLLAQSAQVPVFRAGANLVLVDAYPRRDGRVVDGLTPADFQILEDGKPQNVEAFEFVRVEPLTVDSTRRDPNNLNEMRALAADPHNRVFVTFLDQLHTTIDGSHNIRRPLVNALNRIIGPDDLFGVVTQNTRPQDLTLGRRLESVEDQLAKFWTWGERERISTDPSDRMEDQLKDCFHQRITSAGMEPWIVKEGSVNRFLDEMIIERRREDRTLTALENLVAYMPRLREARTVVLVVTDGWLLLDGNQALQQEPVRDSRFKNSMPHVMGGLTQPRGVQQNDDFAACVGELNRVTTNDNGSRFRELIANANRSNVSVYPIAGGGLATFDQGPSKEQLVGMLDGSFVRVNGLDLSRDAGRVRGRVNTLREIAGATDGIAIVDTNDLEAGFKRIVDDVSAYYLLGYYSTNPKADGRFRRIEVKMRPPGLTVHSRRGYMATKEDAAASARAAAAAPASVAAPVTEALDALGRLRDSAEIFTSATAIAGELTVVVEIAARLIERGAWSKGGEVQIEVSDLAGVKVGTGTAVIEPGARGALTRIALSTLSSSPGPWRVAARLRGPDGVIEDRVEGAAPTGALLGGLVMYRTTPSPRAPLRPAADQQFRRTERVHLEWPRLKVLDARSARLLDRRGQPLPMNVTVTERDAGGQAVVAADILLAPLSAGDYVIELTVGSGAETQRSFSAIRVVG